MYMSHLFPTDAEAFLKECDTNVIQNVHVYIFNFQLWKVDEQIKTDVVDLAALLLFPQMHLLW